MRIRINEERSGQLSHGNAGILSIATTACRISEDQTLRCLCTSSMILESSPHATITCPSTLYAQSLYEGIVEELALSEDTAFQSHIKVPMQGLIMSVA